MPACVVLQFARKYKDPSLARPWSKHSEGSSAHTKAVSASAGGGAPDAGTQKEAGKKKGGNKKPAPAAVSGSAAEVAALVRKLRSRIVSSSNGTSANGRAGKVLSEEDDEKLVEFLSLMAPRRWVGGCTGARVGRLIVGAAHTGHLLSCSKDAAQCVVQCTGTYNPTSLAASLDMPVGHASILRAPARPQAGDRVPWHMLISACLLMHAVALSCGATTRWHLLRPWMTSW